MNHRFVSASLALACLIVIGASVPAQAGDWGRPGYGHHHNVPTPSYWGWKRGHFNHHHGHWGAACTSAVCRLSDAAVPASALLSCSMRGGSGQH